MEAMVTEDVVLLVMLLGRVAEVPITTVPKFRSVAPSSTVPWEPAPLRLWHAVKSRSAPAISRAVAKRRYNR